VKTVVAATCVPLITARTTAPIGADDPPSVTVP